jgi:uncharacterized protein
MKILYLFIFFWFSIFISCNTKQNQRLTSASNITQKREDSLRLKLPLSIGYINDFSSLFTQKQIMELDSIVQAYENQTKVEIAVATVNATIIDDVDFEDFSLVMANTWGVGKKDLANGILILIAADLQRIRIQLGKGIAKNLSNEEVAKIIDQVIISQYTEGNLFEGTKDGVLAIINKLPRKDL